MAPSERRDSRLVPESTGVQSPGIIPWHTPHSASKCRHNRGTCPAQETLWDFGLKILFVAAFRGKRTLPFRGLSLERDNGCSANQLVLCQSKPCGRQGTTVWIG
eukprot:jgi/Botrbrau1/10955/Bobra.0383s0010.1